MGNCQENTRENPPKPQNAKILFVKETHQPPEALCRDGESSTQL